MRNNLSTEQLNTLKYYPNWKQYARLFFLVLFCLSLAAINIILNNTWLFVPIAWLQAFLMACCLVAAHDCAHNTFCSNATICRYLGALLSTPLLVNFSLYRYLHFVHHQLANYPGDTQRPREYHSVLHYLVAIFHWKFSYRFFVLSIQALNSNHHPCIKTSKQRREVKQDAIVFLVALIGLICISVAFPRTMLIGYWLPVLFYLMLVFFFTTAEHTGCDVSKNAFENARTVLKGKLFRFFFWQFNYHAEHHAYPNIPSSNLHKVHYHFATEIKHTNTNYTQMHWHLFKSIYGQPKQ